MSNNRSVRMNQQDKNSKFSYSTNQNSHFYMNSHTTSSNNPVQLNKSANKNNPTIQKEEAYLFKTNNQSLVTEEIVKGTAAPLLFNYLRPQSERNHGIHEPADKTKANPVHLLAQIVGIFGSKGPRFCIQKDLSLSSLLLKTKQKKTTKSAMNQKR